MNILKKEAVQQNHGRQVSMDSLLKAARLKRFGGRYREDRLWLQRSGSLINAGNLANWTAV